MQENKRQNGEINSRSRWEIQSGERDTHTCTYTHSHLGRQTRLHDARRKLKSAASVTPEEREKVHKLCAFPWGVSAIPDEVKRMLAQGAPQHLAHAGQPEDRAAGQQPAAAENFKKKPLRFQFLYTNINFNLKSTQFELSKTRILSKTHIHTHIHVRTHSCHKHKHEDWFAYVLIRITYH